MNTELQQLALEAETRRIETETNELRERRMMQAHSRDYLLIVIITISVLLAGPTQGLSIAVGAVALAVGGIVIGAIQEISDYFYFKGIRS